MSSSYLCWWMVLVTENCLWSRVRTSHSLSIKIQYYYFQQSYFLCKQRWDIMTVFDTYSRKLLFSPGLHVMEPPWGNLGQRGSQWGSCGGLHTSFGNTAWLHQVQIQLGDQLHQPRGIQVSMENLWTKCQALQLPSENSFSSWRYLRKNNQNIAT